MAITHASYVSSTLSIVGTVALWRSEMSDYTCSRDALACLPSVKSNYLQQHDYRGPRQCIIYS